MFLFERDMYKFTRDLASALQYAEGFHVPLNPLKHENLVVSNNKIRYIPHIFLSSITDEMSKDLSNKNIYSGLTVNTNFFGDKMQDKEKITSAQIFEILKKTNEARDPKLVSHKETKSPSPRLKGKKSDEVHTNDTDFKNKNNIISKQLRKLTEKSPSKPTMTVSSPVKKKAAFIEEEKLSFSPSNFKLKKDDEEDNKDRIYTFGILLLLVGILYDGIKFDEGKILTNENFEQIEKRYGKEFLNVIKSMISKEKDKRPNFQMIHDEILNIIKLKGTEDGGFGNDRNKKKMNSLIRIPQHETEKRVKFLHCFPELYQKMLFVNLQDKNQIFYEVQELNVDFIIPVEHRTVGVKIKEKTLIFLLGGKNKNNVYCYNPDTKELEPKR